jgi:NADH:ubiquinone oxidoreductase subunit 3 (subunit A)
MQYILSPPIAFALYVLLVGLLFAASWAVAARGAPNESKTSSYSSGEKAQGGMATPGYRPFFMVAFFFAILHLGVLVAGSGGFTPITGAYILGLIFSLVALALG